MGPLLQSIWDDIQASIGSKVDPSAPPTKVLATDEDRILKNIVEAVDTITTSLTPLPQGVEWVTPPIDPAFGAGTVTEHDAVIKVDGTNHDVDEATLTQPAVATGFHRIDVTVVNYDPDVLTAVYEIILGDAVPTTETVAAPTIPANRFQVRQILVEEGGAVIIPPAVANSAAINAAYGGTTVYPDLTGKLDLTIDANAIPYTVADATWWAPILSSGVAIVKEALDYLQTKVKANTTDIATNTANITANTSAIAALFPAFSALTIGTTTTWATGGAKVNKKTLTLTQNTTLAFTGLANGAEGSLVLKQDGVGARTFSLPAGSLPTSITINTLANGTTFLGWSYDGTNIYWVAKNY